jgi:hypothetical protein
MKLRQFKIHIVSFIAVLTTADDTGYPGWWWISMWWSYRVRRSDNRKILHIGSFMYYQLWASSCPICKDDIRDVLKFKLQKKKKKIENSRYVRSHFSDHKPPKPVLPAFPSPTTSHCVSLLLVTQRILNGF